MDAFRVVAGKLETIIEDDEREVLAHLASEVAELLGIDVAQRAGELGLFDDASGPSSDVEDQWEEITRALQMADTDGPEMVGPPADPAVERLLPPVSEDPAIDDEYRRLTQTGLRMRKGDRLVRFWVYLQPENGPLLRLNAGQAEEFMAAITDIRLVVGQRLGIETSDDLESLRLQFQLGEEPDQRAGLLQISDVLAWWQESLISGLQMLGDAH